MEPSTTPDYEKTAREMIASRVGDKPGGPAIAGQICAQMIASAAHSAKDTRSAILGICKGVMGGMFLHGQDLPETASQILNALPNISLMTRVDPQEIMNWVMEGIAETAPMIGMNTCTSIQYKIEECFIGTGAVFNKLCQDAVKKQQPQ